ncbi:hypothetical protein [Paeniglutamicibacter cryotolerans]|uniref:Uncharacterized protein n=1 Tax=Paeniglutamicibacter cryotolerans TaxID=670079 RepID=A0A839QE58_9MICC|nr:hypothetical protein [Paeniglutamicibacter cryotolerans]MBB2993877.1 hypothetical protein [Paeniglutamicibacter cryotolerans]
MPSRLRLEAPSAAELTRRIRAEHGPAARIISAEKVTRGGVGGFLGRTHYEALIEIPDEGTGPAAPVPAAVPGPAVPAAPASRGRRSRATAPASRVGIAALLAEAEGAEARIHGREEPVVATGTPDFARVMDQLAFEQSPRRRALEPGPAPASAATPTGPGVRVPLFPGPARLAAQDVAAPRGPLPLHGPGDLVLVIGLWADAHGAARVLAPEGAIVAAVGELAAMFAAGSAAVAPLADRRAVLGARAGAVAAGVPLVVALALDPVADMAAQLAPLELLSPDQLWAAVDAGRKPVDSAAWLAALGAVHQIDAVAALNRAETLSPETVDELGFPVLDVAAFGRARTKVKPVTGL